MSWISSTGSSGKLGEGWSTGEAQMGMLEGAGAPEVAAEVLEP